MISEESRTIILQALQFARQRIDEYDYNKVFPNDYEAAYSMKESRLQEIANARKEVMDVKGASV